MGLKEMIENKFGEVYMEMIEERRNAPSSKPWGKNNFGTSKELEWQVKNKYYALLKDIMNDGKEFGCNFGTLGERIKNTKPTPEPSNFSE